MNNLFREEFEKQANMLVNKMKLLKQVGVKAIKRHKRAQHIKKRPIMTKLKIEFNKIKREELG